ncbi:MAG: hypothetical protein ACXAB7_00160 [Candidatus Kariarchaeaceae archaeon]|jgi:hypothetical protein
MLQVPVNTIRWYQFTFIILVSLGVSGSIFLMISQSNDFLPTSGNTSYDTNETEFVTGDKILPTDALSNPIIGIIPLLLGLFVIFFYIPTRSSLGLSNKAAKKEISLNKYGIPERGYSIPYGKMKIKLTRKILSINGLFGKEIVFSLHISKDHPEKKRIFDFLSCEEMTSTSSSTIMHKTVNIRNIPMMILRTKALVSLLSSGEKDQSLTVPPINK